jgi:hypothetical protein
MGFAVSMTPSDTLKTTYNSHLIRTRDTSLYLYARPKLNKKLRAVK